MVLSCSNTCSYFCIIRQEEGWVALLQSECNHTAVACELWKNGDTFNRFGVYDIRVRVKNGLAEAVSYLGAVSPFDIGKEWLDMILIKHDGAGYNKRSVLFIYT